MTIKMRMTLMKNSNLIQIDLDLVCIVAIAVGISLLLHSASMKSSWLFKCFQPASMCVDVFKYMCYVSMHFNVLMCVQCFFQCVLMCFSEVLLPFFKVGVVSHLGSGVGEAHDSITVHYCVPVNYDRNNDSNDKETGKCQY